MNMPKNRQQCLNVLKKQRGNDRMTSLTQFMESTYPRIMGIPFDKYVFAESIIRLGGVDMEDFSAQDIVDMCDEKFHGNLRDVPLMRLWAAIITRKTKKTCAVKFSRLSFYARSVNGVMALPPTLTLSCDPIGTFIANWTNPLAFSCLTYAFFHGKINFMFQKK